MNTQTVSEARLELHHWIDRLPPHQLDLIYRLVAEIMEEPMDETAYLLSSDTMRQRLLAARDSKVGIPFEVVREKLGI